MDGTDLETPVGERGCSSDEGYHKEADTVSLTARFWGRCYHYGNARLDFGSGSGEAEAPYNSTEGKFIYTVAAGDNDHDGIKVKGINLNSGTIQETSSSKDVSTTLTMSLQVGSGGVKVDTQVPEVADVTLPDSMTYGTSEVLEFIVIYNEVVTVDDSSVTPKLVLDIDSTNKDATYVDLLEDKKLRFRYTVEANLDDGDGVGLTRQVLPNNVSIQDRAGNGAVLDFSSLVLDLTGVKVDTTPPTITRVDHPRPQNLQYRRGLRFYGGLQ